MRWLRLVGVALLATAGLLGAGLGVAAWRLHRGPVSLDFLIPRITAELAGEDGGWRIAMGGLELAWVAAHRQAELRARDLRVTRSAGGATLALDAVRLRLDRRALLHGDLELVGIELDAPALQLVRDPAGRFAMRLGEAASSNGWLAAQLARLRHVAVRDGRVDVVDESSRARWALPRVAVDAWRDADPLRVHADVAIGAGAAVVPVAVDAVYRFEARRLELDASAPGTPTETALAAWPAAVAPGARAWLVSHLSGGRIGEASATVTGGVAAEDGALAIDDVAARVAFSGLAVRWLDGMPPVRAVGGVARFSRTGVVVDVASGTLERVVVGPATVRVGWRPGAAPHLAVDAACRGPVASVMDVLGRQPIALDQRAISPTGVFTGAVSGHVRVAFPLAPPPKAGRLGLQVKARTADAGVPAIVGDWDLAGGALQIDVRDRTVAIDGSARVRGVPVTLRFDDDLAAHASRRLEVAGRLRPDDLRALGLEPPPGLDGPADVRARVTPAGDGRSTLQLDADLAPASIDVPALALRKPAGAPGRALARLAVGRGSVDAVEQVDVTAGGVAIHGSAGRAPAGSWSRVDGDVGFTVDGRSDAAALRFALRADRDAWRTTVTSDDVGQVLLAYGLDRARGGRLLLDGTSHFVGGGLDFAGELSVRDTTLSRVPWLLRAVSLASIRGLLDVASPQTIPLDRIAATILHRPPGTIEIRDGVASGPKLAIDVAGTVDRTSGTLDLQGMLVPSYYLLNQRGDRIPVLGPLVGRATGGAIQGVDFTVTGRNDDPVVSVKPVSSLAPGVLRDWLRKLGM